MGLALSGLATTVTTRAPWPPVANLQVASGPPRCPTPGSEDYRALRPRPEDPERHRNYVLAFHLAYGTLQCEPQETTLRMRAILEWNLSRLAVHPWDVGRRSLIDARAGGA